MEYSFTIPGRLPNLNDYISAENTNRYKGAQLKADAQARVVIAIKQHLCGVQIKSPVRMQYKWYERNRRRDLDNISSFGRKVIQDALVTAGVLADDGWKHIKSFADSFYVDAENPRIEVYITEVPE